MNEFYTIQQAVTFLQQMQDILIITHKNPDGDTLGSGYGLWAILRQIGIRAKVENEGSVPVRYAHMTDYYNEQVDANFQPKYIITVDTAALKLMGDNMSEMYGDKVDLSIDHHATNDCFAKATLCDPKSASCCEIVAQLIEPLGAQFDKYIAGCIYTGLATDTGCFKYSNTTANTHILAAQLIDIGVNFAGLNRLLFETKSRQRAELEQLAVANMEFSHDDKIAIIMVTHKMLAQTGCDPSDIEGITPIPRTIEGVEVGVTMRELSNGSFKVSLRTVRIDASKICAEFGGGGHKRAAGFEMNGTIEQIKKATILAIEKVL